MSSSSLANKIGITPNLSSLLQAIESRCNDAEVNDISKNPGHGIASWSDYGMEQLRRNGFQGTERFGDGGRKVQEAFASSSGSDERRLVCLQHVNPTTRNISSCSNSSLSSTPRNDDTPTSSRSIIPVNPKSSFIAGAGSADAFGKEFPKKIGDSNSAGAAANHRRFRINQTEQWYQRYLDMVEFQEKYGHCLVPLHWPTNPSLAHWVKRQRRQYRAKQEHKHSTLTPERQWLLEQIGFVWDSHASVWEERLKELQDFKEKHGHCHVPKTYDANPQLAIWVKCQRRQFKLYSEGKDSNMTIERIHKLQQFGFVFTPREKRDETMMNVCC